MKTIFCALIALAWPIAVSAGPKEDLAARRQTQREALEMFRRGEAARATGHVREKAIGVGHHRDVESVQSLMQLTVLLFAEKRQADGFGTLRDAVTIATELRRQGHADRLLADVYQNLGYLLELYAAQPEEAEQFYNAALAIHPGHPQAKQRSDDAKARIKQRKGEAAR